MSIGDPATAARPQDVLLLEDDDLLADLLARSLARSGCQVHRFSRAEDADAAVLGGLEGVLVSDVRLSGPMSGIDLLTRLRARGDERPAVLMSGLHDAAGERAVLAAGVAEVLHKPFSLADLRIAVERMLACDDAGDPPPHRSN